MASIGTAGDAGKVSSKPEMLTASMSHILYIYIYIYIFVLFSELVHLLMPP